MDKGTQEAAGAARSIWQELDVWGAALPRWQRFVLARSVADGRLTDDQIDAAYRLMLADNGLGGEPSPPVPSITTISGRPQDTTAPLRLVAIRKARDVNALPQNAELTFGPGLTVIYGLNGTGKSGFFRLLSAACFSRSPKKTILPNVYDGRVPPPVPSAEIVVADGVGPERSITVSPTTGETELRRLSVFDAAIARVHVDDENAFSFKPTGFDVFPEMVRVHARLIARVEQDIKARTKPNDFPNLFAGSTDTPASRAVAALSAATEPDAVSKLGMFGEAEKAQFAETARQLGELRATSVDHMRQQTEQDRADVEQLRQALDAAGLRFNQWHCERYAKCLADYDAASKAASGQGLDALKNQHISQVGSPAWERFVAAAYDLAKQESPEYPGPGSPCLLCHRPVDDSAHTVLHATWRYLQGEAKRRAVDALDLMRSDARVVRAVALDVFQPESRVRPYLERVAPDVAKSVAAAIEWFRGARETLATTLEGGVGPVPASVDLRPQLDRLAQLVAGLDAEIERLKTQNKDEAIRTLTQRYTELRHQEVLAQNLQGILSFVADAAWAAKAGEVRRRALPTTPITLKETQLSAELVGAGYQASLATALDEFGCGFALTPQMKGKSGRTVRTLTLSSKNRPADVLSEGEQRAVALADFLTEVNLNPDAAGVVLDDPVSSLDHERKERIAKRLVAESRSRQVIVFTHDMEFLAQIGEACKRNGVKPVTHWVDRDGAGNPGAVALNDGPLTSGTFKNAEYARSQTTAAKAAVGQARIEALRRGFGAVRTCLERLVLDVLLKDVVSPYRRQVRMSALERVAWDADAARDIARAFEDASAYIDAHFRPDGAAGSAPTVADLETFIATYETLRARANNAGKPKPT
jgi:energy-coupling factor transporter ATP-binding protein EcfA2